MKIAIRCEKCSHIFMQGEDDLCLEINFKDKVMTFICPNCKHDNTLDFGDWKKKQEHSPLPTMGISHG